MPENPLGPPVKVSWVPTQAVGTLEQVVGAWLKDSIVITLRSKKDRMPFLWKEKYKVFITVKFSLSNKLGLPFPGEGILMVLTGMDKRTVTEERLNMQYLVQ